MRHYLSSQSSAHFGQFFGISSRLLFCFRQIVHCSRLTNFGFVIKGKKLSVLDIYDEDGR